MQNIKTNILLDITVQNHFSSCVCFTGFVSQGQKDIQVGISYFCILSMQISCLLKICWQIQSSFHSCSLTHSLSSDFCKGLVTSDLYKTKKQSGAFQFFCPVYSSFRLFNSSIKACNERVVIMQLRQQGRNNGLLEVNFFQTGLPCSGSPKLPPYSPNT